MHISNKEIAEVLNEIADYLEIQEKNEFRVRSYRNAARRISNLDKNITEMAKNKEDIESIPDIGESMAEKIEEIAKTGKISQLDELREKLPATLIEIMNLEQMGPKKTKVLYKQLGIESIEDLKKAAEDGKIDELEGFGKKTIKKILKEIKEYNKKGGSERFLLNDAEEIIQPMLEYLKKDIQDITIAGSYRRMKETVGDIDLVGTSKDSEKAMKRFVNYDEVKDVINQGKTKSIVKLRSGLQVDIRIVEKKSFGAAELYFTGSKSHTIALRKIAREKDYKVNEYGIYKGKKQIAGKTEEEMYEKLGLKYIEPELRENNGEIDAAKNNKLPKLITLDDIRGDLHTHSNETDGTRSIEAMAKAAKKKGYDYLAINDHSKKVSMAKGLDKERLINQIEEIDEINKKMKDFRILKSIEVDILEDGSLDLSDDVLKKLDLVVCAVHYNRNLSKRKQTKRILKAMDNPYFNILAHPTGRMINKRDELNFDIKEVMKEAKNNGCFLEINSNPDRLDLYDKYIKSAKEIGLKLAVSTDAHSVSNLDYIKYGVAQARRGWLEKDDVINTRKWNELKKLLKR